MKRTILLISFLLLTACTQINLTQDRELSQQSTSTLSTWTQTPPPDTVSPTIIPSVDKASELFHDLSINYFDEFQALYRSKGWELYAGTIQNGVLGVEGNNWNGLVRSSPITEGTGVAIDFSYTENALFEIFLGNGEWDTEGYKRFGIYVDNDQLVSNTWLSSEGIGKDIFEGDLKLTPNTSYSLLLAPLEDGDFIIIVWETSDPSKSTTYRESLGEDWSEIEWTFTIGADKGFIEFDNFVEFTFDSTNIPTITPTPVPQPTPTIIGGYSNRYLSPRSPVELRGAGGEQIETFIVLPEEFTGNYIIVRWAPTGKYVAINYLTDDVGHLYILDAQANEIAYFRNGRYFSIGSGGWDSSGRYMVFSSNGDNTYADIYLFDTVTETVTQLTNTYTLEQNPTFTPDDQQIIWYVGYDGSYIMDLDGKNKRSLGIATGIFDWSPDGKTILFDENNDLYLLDLETRQKTRLTFNGSMADELRPLFSPDGRAFTYLEYGYPGQGKRFPKKGFNLYSVQLDNPNRRIFLGTLNWTHYEYTPDQNQLLCSGWPPTESIYGEPKVYTIRPDGTDITLLSSRAIDLLNGHWQPNAEVNQPFDPLAFLAPTPIPNWLPATDTSVYDSFEESHLSTDLWTVQIVAEVEGFSYVILDEALNIRNDKEIEQGGFDIYSTDEIPMKSLTVYEARVKTYSGSYGESYAGIGLETELNGYLWSVECKLGNDWEEPIFYCQVAQTYEDHQIIEYAIRERPVELNSWYEVRIEISPEYGALQFSLNGEILGTYLPDNASHLLASAKLRPVMGVWCTDGSINASFDDVIVHY